jgi:hypothetical protein
MKADDAARAADLVKALREIPKVRRQLKSGKSKYYDGYALEIQSAEMSDGESQESDHWFDVPRELAGPILDAAENVLRDELKRLDVSP